MSRHLKISVTLLTLSLALPVLSWSQAAPNAGGGNAPPSQGPDRVPERQSDQVANIPYFTLRDGLSSTLTLNNNAPTPTSVTVTIFNTEGRAKTLDPITLDPHLFKQIELRDVIGSEQFNEGSVSAAYYGKEMDVTTQVSVYSLERRVSFESREQGMFDFESNVSNGILSLPQTGARGFLAITNVSKNKITIQLTVASKTKEIILYSRETRLVKLDEEFGLHAPTAALVKMTQSGIPGDIMSTGFVMNEEIGYSSAFTMVDSKVMRSSHLAGAHFRFGQPDPSEGFPAGTTFTSPLLLANVSDKPVVAHVSVDYTVAEKLAMTPINPKQGDTRDRFSDVALKDVTIAPGAIERIELQDELAKLGVPTPVKEAGVDIDYQAPPGSLIGHLVSANQTGNYAFEVPIKDAFAWNAMIEGIYPWTLENGTRAVLHLKNRTDQAVHAWTTISFPGGTYNFPLLSFEPYQTIAIDIQALKDSKKPDARGKPFPTDATHGQIVWFPEEPYSLVGRAEQTNLSEGIARSFSCGVICCVNYYGYVCATSNTAQGCSPNWSVGGQPAHIPVQGLTGAVGGSGTLGAYTYGTDCNYNEFGPSPISPYSWSWFTNPANVVSVSGSGSGNVSYTAAGTTKVGVNANIPQYSFYGCVCNASTRDLTTSDASEQAPVQVNLTPDHVRVVSDAQGYPNCPPGQGPAVYVRQMQMQLVNVNNVTVPVNYSNREAFTAQSTNSCGNGNANPSGCGATGPTACANCANGQWLDAMSVSGLICTSGINPASDCGFTLTSDWGMCSNGLNNSVWTSTRETRSDRALVNNQAASYPQGTQLY